MIIDWDNKRRSFSTTNTEEIKYKGYIILRKEPNRWEVCIFQYSQHHVMFVGTLTYSKADPLHSIKSRIALNDRICSLIRNSVDKIPPIPPPDLKELVAIRIDTKEEALELSNRFQKEVAHAMQQGGERYVFLEAPRHRIQIRILVK